MTKRSNVSHEQLAAWGRLGQLASAATPEQRKQREDAKAERLYAFLREYFAAKGYAPSWPEFRHAHLGANIGGQLRALERSGRIQLHPWNRGITLSQVESEPPSIAFCFGVEPATQSFASILVPRATRKCYDCDDPAVAGKTRCQRHLRQVSAASSRNHKRKCAQKKVKIDPRG